MAALTNAIETNPLERIAEACGSSGEPRLSAERIAAIHLLNVAVVLRSEDGRSVLKCRMCGGTDDEHIASCPVPLLEEWINPVP
jgi:hypothetical protein